MPTVPEPPEPALRIQHQEGARVLVLEGELDMADTEPVRKVFDMVELGAVSPRITIAD